MALYELLQKRQAREGNREYQIKRAAIGAAFSEKAPDKLFHEGSGQNCEYVDLSERRKRLIEEKNKQEQAQNTQ